MTTWSAQDRERKKRIVTNLFRQHLRTVRARHPATGEPCTHPEAMAVLGALQEHVVARFAEQHGFALAAQYRALIIEVLGELATQGDA